MLLSYEAAWLDFAHDMITKPGLQCTCEPYSDGVRWPGYIGSEYRGVLFVGARHHTDGLKKADLKRGPLARYVAALRTWSAASRDGLTSLGSDALLLETMRSAYRHSYPIWAKKSVWSVFEQIRLSIGLSWDNVASINLARCYDPPDDKTDDIHISSHLKAYSLQEIIDVFKPRIVFLSKDNEDVRPMLQVDDSRTTCIIERFSNYGLANRRNDAGKLENWRIWVPRESHRWKTALGSDNSDCSIGPISS